MTRSDGVMPPGVRISTQEKMVFETRLVKAGRVGVDERWVWQ